MMDLGASRVDNGFDAAEQGTVTLVSRLEL
jgi:hypothetical protein